MHFVDVLPKDCHSQAVRESRASCVGMSRMSSMRSTRPAYSVVGLETEFTLEWGEDGSLETTLAGERETTELGVDEELTVEDGRGRVEGSAWDGWVNIVLGSNGVGDQEPDNLELVEATSIVEAGQDLVDSICVARE